MTTNKLVRLEDVLKIINTKNTNENDIEKCIYALHTYPEPTKWSNHALLQEYIDSEGSTYTQNILEEIQSRLTEWTEYDIGKEYEFSDDGEYWVTDRFMWYAGVKVCKEYIRPIQPVSPELTSAISVLEANWYTVCKK
jgi:hypothetical protein